MRQTILAVAAAALLWAGVAQTADIDRYGSTFNRSGFIANGIGEKCWYRQVFEETNPHFMKPGLKNTTYQEVRIILFEDPKCMAHTLNDLEIYEPINRLMINNVITRWVSSTYVRRDADFDTRNLRRHGKHEARGYCIQSARYPSKGITIEYEGDGESIASVIYMLALGGCGEPL